MLKRFTLAVTILTLIAVAGLFGKRSDADTLASVGKVIADKARAGLPERSPIAAPLTALKPSDKFPLAERVRARITNDKLMAGSEVDVVTGAEAGQVKLRGTAATLLAKTRAVQLALETVGVETVTAEELAVR